MLSFILGSDVCKGLASLEFFINDGNALVLGFGFGYPVAVNGSPPGGLSPGAIYNNGRTLCVVPGATPDPTAPPVYFGLITPAQLLALGAANLPMDAPEGSLQLYSPAGQIFIAGGAGLSSDGGVLVLTTGSGYPTSPSGLPAGAVWSNDMALAVVPGATPDPSATPVFFGTISAIELLALGGGNLPITSPAPDTLQLWNNGGEIAIA